MAQLSDEEVKEVHCIYCNAKPGKPCTELGSYTVLLGFHKERIALREQMPVYSCPLDPTDKAVIIGYAFVMLANSCAANSVLLFGKPYTTQEIQRTFAEAGMKAAMTDGFIGPEKIPAEPAYSSGKKIFTDLSEKATPNRHERRKKEKVQ